MKIGQKNKLDLSLGILGFHMVLAICVQALRRIGSCSSGLVVVMLTFLFNPLVSKNFRQMWRKPNIQIRGVTVTRVGFLKSNQYKLCQLNGVMEFFSSQLMIWGLQNVINIWDVAKVHKRRIVSLVIYYTKWCLLSLTISPNDCIDESPLHQI